MDHEDRVINREIPWRQMLLKPRSKYKQTNDTQAINEYRHFFLRYSVESLNDRPLEPLVWGQNRQLTAKDFPNGVVDMLRHLNPKNEESKLKKVLTKCDFLYKNLLDGGFDRCSEALLFAVSIVQKNNPLVLCARSTYDRSYYYIIPIVRQIILQSIKKKEPADDEHPLLKSLRSLYRQIREHNDPAQPQVLILCPAESVSFLYNRVSRLCQGSWIKVAAVTSTKKKLARDTTILIADPYDLSPDLLNVSFSSVKYCALDECDVFFRSIYSERLGKLLSQLPSKCHRSIVLGFLSHKSMRFVDANFINYCALVCGGFPSMTMYTRHKVIYCEEDRKPMMAANLIAQYRDVPIIIYVSDPNVKAVLSQELAELAKPSGQPMQFNRTARILVLKDNMLPLEREELFSQFTQLLDPVLITSDEAAMDLEFRDVPVLINYDLPPEVETFVSRHKCIGRTPLLPQYYSFPNRSDGSLKLIHSLLLRDWLEKEGFNKPPAISYTFYNKLNDGMASDLIDLLEECQEAVPPFLKQAATFQPPASQTGPNSQISSRRNSLMGYVAKLERFNPEFFHSEISIRGKILPILSINPEPTEQPALPHIDEQEETYKISRQSSLDSLRFLEG